MIIGKSFPIYRAKINKRTKPENEYAFSKTLLGLASDNPSMIIRYQKEGFPYKALSRLQAVLDMSEREVASLIKYRPEDAFTKTETGTIGCVGVRSIVAIRKGNLESNKCF